MTPPAALPTRPRTLRRVWIWALVVAFVAPWVFGFASTNAPGFTQGMVAAAPFYAGQAAFVSFVVLILAVAAIGLFAELRLAPAAPDIRRWQLIGAILALVLAVLAVPFVLVRGVPWLW